MTDVLRTFDAGVAGATVVGGTNGVDSVVEGTQVYENGYSNVGIRAGGAANTANTRYNVLLGVTGNHFGSVILTNKTAHGSGSASCNFFYLVDSTNTNMARFRAKPGNGLSIIAPEPTEVRAGSAGEIPLNSPFRFDWNVAGTVLTWKLYNNPEAAALSTPSLTGTVTVAGTANKVILGAQSSSAIIKDWSADTFRVTNTGSWFGPYVPPTSGPTAKWYNGVSSEDVNLKWYNGAAEVAISAFDFSP